jgi:hypothetical protein
MCFLKSPIPTFVFYKIALLCLSNHKNTSLVPLPIFSFPFLFVMHFLLALNKINVRVFLQTGLEELPPIQPIKMTCII